MCATQLCRSHQQVMPEEHSCVYSLPHVCCITGGGMAGSDPSSSSSPSSSFSFVRPSHAARGIPVSSLPSTSAGTGGGLTQG
jgi:hypothetical protein